jgi:FkbM family methyltransferase
MGLYTTLKFIANHPLNRGEKLKGISRFVKWQLTSLVNPYPIVYTLTEKSNLIIRKGMTGATGNLYCGLHDFNDMFFLLHFLREEDLFIDIGANIGSYTVLAAAHVGAACISIEPSPSTFSHLKRNIALNNIEQKTEVLNIGLGSKKGIVNFTAALDTQNHVATPGDTDIIQINIDKADNVFSGRKPALLKIDVEGFETEVLNGASEILSTPSLKAIIIELNGSGDKYGYNDDLIHESLLTYGFYPYEYDPPGRTLNKIENPNSQNVIYVRDTDYVNSRLQSAKKVRILNKII